MNKVGVRRISGIKLMGEKLVPVAHQPPHIPQGVAQLNPSLHDDRTSMQQTYFSKDSSFPIYDTTLLPTLQKSLLLLFLRK
jgi:hypothetical protein